MSDTIRIQDLPTDEIIALLARDGSELTPQQVVALQEFVDNIGGIENAFAAVEMLSELEDAA
ncbi:MAG: hypothetical protein JJ992_17085 [Planctomycetes bacterium]|nr:hypothetical protein [Planctomycetota bacterium]